MFATDNLAAVAADETEPALKRLIALAPMAAMQLVPLKAHPRITAEIAAGGSVEIRIRCAAPLEIVVWLLPRDGAPEEVGRFPEARPTATVATPRKIH